MITPSEPQTITEAPLIFTQGNYTVRLAETETEIAAAQALRYRVFYRENGARPNSQQKKLERDIDKFDDYCEHLLVTDENKQIVGTYRMLRRASAAHAGGFLTAEEYNLTPLLEQNCEILELSRACVESAYRQTPVMQLLWQGLSAYVLGHGIKYMFGCASFPGTDITSLHECLAYLYHEHLAPETIRVTAHPDLYRNMHSMPPEKVNKIKVFKQIPSLMKGYLRLGCWVGDGAVIDPVIRTVDVCVVVDTDNVAKRYYKHYARTSTN